MSRCVNFFQNYTARCDENSYANAACNEKRVFVNMMAVRVDRYGRKITESRRLHKVIETARARRLLPKHNEKIRGSSRNAFAYCSASD